MSASGPKSSQMSSKCCSTDCGRFLTTWPTFAMAFCRLRASVGKLLASDVVRTDSYFKVSGAAPACDKSPHLGQSGQTFRPSSCEPEHSACDTSPLCVSRSPGGAVIWAPPMEPPASPLTLVPLSFAFIWLGAFLSCSPFACSGQMLEPERPINSTLPVENCPVAGGRPQGSNSGRIPWLQAPGPEGQHEKHRAKIQESIFTQASTIRRCCVLKTFSGPLTWPGPSEQEQRSDGPAPNQSGTELRTLVRAPEPCPVFGSFTPLHQRNSAMYHSR